MKLKKIPKKYQFIYNPQIGNFSRKEQSPYVKGLRNTTLEDLPCPLCGRKYLRIGNFGWDSILPDFRVTCDNCEFTCPCGSKDYGEAKCEFEFWTEAFLLLGSPYELRNSKDIELYMYQEGISREKKFKELNNKYD